MTTTNQKMAALKICAAIIETVKETPEGVPGGILYAALMAHGFSLEQFEKIMNTIVRSGILRQRGQLYFFAEKNK